MEEGNTRELRLAGGAAVTVDEEDFWRFWKEKLFSSSGFACYRDEEGRVHRLHREILDVRDSRIVLHLDGNPLNCTRANLLIRDRGIFGRARPGQGACRYKGVSPYRGKWQATIRIEGKLKWLGSFETAEEAAEAYDDAVLEHRGRTGVLNFPKRRRRRRQGAESGQTAASGQS
jgi:hypothetical protein